MLKSVFPSSYSTGNFIVNQKPGNGIPMTSIFCRSLLMVLVFLPSVSLAEEVAKGIKPTTWWRGGGGGGSSKFQFYGTYGYAGRPDNRVLSQITVKWLSIERDPLGNLCKVRGHLQFSEGGITKNVDWFQGVTVCMSKRPYQELDWSKGTDEKDTRFGAGITLDRLGTFEVAFSLRDIQSDRNLQQAFQFGIALAKHEDTDQGEKVSWDSYTPAIPSTVKMLNVSVAPKISHELELINHVNPWLWPWRETTSMSFQVGRLNGAFPWAYNRSTGVDLIRAVNAVRRMGKEKGLATLEEFLELSVPKLGLGPDQDTVVWIIRLAFESDPSKDIVPFPEVCGPLCRPGSPARQSWPLDPLELTDDLPFKVAGEQDGMSMAMNNSKSHLEWAHENGVIRDRPLVPLNDPLTAAQEILSSQRLKSLEEHTQERITHMIRDQAIMMVPDLVNQFPKPNKNNFADMVNYDAEWAALLEFSKQFDIIWDQQSEDFVVRRK
jgi:hypothetical protein